MSSVPVGTATPRSSRMAAASRAARCDAAPVDAHQGEARRCRPPAPRPRAPCGRAPAPRRGRPSTSVSGGRPWSRRRGRGSGGRGNLVAGAGGCQRTRRRWGGERRGTSPCPNGTGSVPVSHRARALRRRDGQAPVGPSFPRRDDRDPARPRLPTNPRESSDESARARGRSGRDARVAGRGRGLRRGRRRGAPACPAAVALGRLAAGHLHAGLVLLRAGPRLVRAPAGEHAFRPALPARGNAGAGLFGGCPCAEPEGRAGQPHVVACGVPRAVRRRRAPDGHRDRVLPCFAHVLGPDRGRPGDVPARHLPGSLQRLADPPAAAGPCRGPLRGEQRPPRLPARRPARSAALRVRDPGRGGARAGIRRAAALAGPDEHEAAAGGGGRSSRPGSGSGSST